MQTTNDYDRDIYNGDLGLLIDFDHEERVATVAFDDRRVKIDEKGLRNLVPAYAISIHKSQGSEYPAVVIPLLTEHYIMLRRRLLYTAVTRGKRLVILVGSLRALQQAVRTADGADARHSRLAARIRELGLVQS
jgi:exodeoxyribonuclease V alpha subunit